MPRKRTLAQQAHGQTASAYRGQKHGVRHDTRQQVRSLRSEQAALEHSLALAEAAFRRAGLQGDDLRMALSELASRRVDVGAGTALQVKTVRQDAASQLQDLRASQASDEQSVLEQLRQDAEARRQDNPQFKATQTAKEKIALLALQNKLGIDLGVDPLKKGGEDHGLTDTQRRARGEEHRQAAFWAKDAFQKLKAGAADPEAFSGGDDAVKKQLEAVPDDPSKWDDSTWHSLITNVLGKEGVEDPRIAEHAVTAIRHHVNPPADIPGAVSGLGSIAGLLAPQILGRATGQNFNFAESLFGR